MSRWLCQLLLGSTVRFRQLPSDVKASYPFAGRRTISLVCSGMGIAPMYQILSKMKATSDERSVVLLYGSETSGDILLKHELDALLQGELPKLKLVHVLRKLPNELSLERRASITTCTFESGRVDKTKIVTHAFPPSTDGLMVVCGDLPLCEHLLGPGGQLASHEGGALHMLGYTNDMVINL